MLEILWIWLYPCFPRLKIGISRRRSRCLIHCRRRLFAMLLGWISWSFGLKMLVNPSWRRLYVGSVSKKVPWSIPVSNRLWCFLTLPRDNLLGDILQRPAYIREELQKCQTSMESLEANDNGNAEEYLDKRNQISQHKAELRLLEQSYQEFNEILHGVVAAIPTGVLGKEFRALTKDPDWYLNPQLRQDCADQDGCCGWTCGCCEKDREVSFPVGMLGHCPGFCGCARGIRIRSRNE